MEIVSTLLLSQNITIVYSTLEVREVDSHRLKKILGDQALITVMPDTLVAIDPTGPMVIQFGDRRLRVTWQGANQELLPLWEIANQCHELVPETKLIAFGFNYDVRIKSSDGDLTDHILKMFSTDPSKLSEKLGGSLLSISPRIKFKRDKTLYDLVLEPLDRERATIHLNSHFEHVDFYLDAEKLQRSYTEEYRRLLEVLPTLIT